jgi:hypothetical protein
MGTILLTLMLSATVDTGGPDTLVVCPRDFRAALEPWLALRRQQGHVCHVLEPRPSADELRRDVVAAGKSGKLRFIVLVGDVPSEASRRASSTLNSIPTFQERARVNVAWGSESRIASDQRYADFDGDGVADAAIGRLTADTSEELALVVRKILAYEQSAGAGLWQRRIHLVAGVGGFGVVADAAIEAATRMLVTTGIPSSYAITMTRASWRSPYCPDPRDFRDTTVQGLNEGGLFWVYMGHGQRQFLEPLRVPGKQYEILSVRDVPRLRCVQGAPIAVFLACYTGAFDDRDDCLAEELLRRDEGPVAILAGSRMTMPYGMSVLANCLLHEAFVEQRPALGEIILHAKRSAVSEKNLSRQRQALDAVAALVSPQPALLADERREHALLMNLIGDPLLRISRPQVARVETASRITAGQPVEVRGTSPVDGKCTVELVVRRERLTFVPPERKSYVENDRTRGEYRETYRRANDPCLAATTTLCRRGEFTARLSVPSNAQGPCHVRVFVHGDSQSAIGATDVDVARASGAVGAAVGAR